ncbi:uncharacterized protein LOC142239506 [Haematobia irritans]|uniref:uncharacterized protein LOC142239506 n=1 Tax=Haematobia irritans TaxID=7368 RepID=UPI003F4F9B30
MSEFIFDSDNLVTFCANFGDIRAEDLSDSRLEIALQELDERWAALQKSYKQLCLSTDPKTEQGILESSREKYSKCTHDFLSCKSKILDAQKALITPSTTLIENQVSSSIPCLKVPPCDTEIFYGSYEEWPSFRDMFSAVYGEHPKLSAVQKLYHLRLKTRGQAALIVKKYRLCGENFSLAWEALRSRYENRRILVDNQLKVLLNLKPISSESSEALQDIQAMINDCLAALKAQQISTSDWDPILVYVCSTKLPHETLSLWEQSLKSHRDLPSWKQMDTFLSNRYEVVERLNSIQGVKSTSRKRPESDVHAFNTESQSNFPCKMCQMNHPLKNCQQFLNMNAQARSNFVRDNKICLNCLSYTHVRNECKSKFLCTTCNKNHHTLLHFSNSNSKSSPPKPPSNSTATVNTNQAIEQPSTSNHVSDQNVTRTSAHYISNNNHLSENTLLPTAIVSITHNGDIFSARAFLDQGSEKTFISRRLQQRLSLPTEPKSFEIRGMSGNVVAHSNSLCHLTLYSPNHDCTLVVQAIVVPKITRLLPNFVVSKSDYDLSEISNLNLADPNFYSPGPVDLLIGSNVIPKLLLDGVKKLSNSLLAQATIFGWIISGPLETRKSSTFSIGATETSEDPLLKQLRLFWEQEEIATQKTISDDDEYCESFFTQTTTRNSSGRYIVKLPFKSEYPRNIPLGPSRPIALIQFIRLEQSLKRNPELANSYQNILKEYISLGHMEEVSSKEMIENGVFNSYYLPHHAVLKPDSRSTKVRVVFNASRRTYSGNSLNDTLHVGPSLQLDLSTLILNWRLYKYVFSGDIEKMYRQILVHPTDTNFQRILFRPDPTSPIKDYALKTVTFGVNSAPFLAIRTLLQLAYDSAETHPAASRILQKEIYVDDILSGGHDINSAIDSLCQLRALLNSAGFPLKKITSNTPEVLNSVPKDCLLDSNFLKFNETSSAKTLGIQWNALTDQFSYQIDVISPSEQITKRQILSAASKLFDPAGWISPIIVQAKLILQQLWLEGTDWDENVKPSSLLKWNQFVQDLSQLPHIKIPRYIYFSPQVQTQIHGFCDASQKAYCATIYLRFNNQNSVQCNLLVSKTKVAPIDPISLPRLELCGALLLSKLAKQIISSLPIHSNDLFLWCDSTIVLGWLEKPPSTWKTYVANRTAEIIRNVGNCSWRHVRSSDNPADLGSRGCSSLDLVNNPLWWHGPMWLLNPPEEWPKSTISFENPPEMKKVIVFHNFNEEFEILDRFSKWDKAIRVICYIFRFFSKLSKGFNYPLVETHKISSQEFNFLKIRLISLTQRHYYAQEYHSLKNLKNVNKKSSLFPLHPFIDENDIIRVNGRLVNADLSYNEKYPIILPVQSKFSQLFISFIHDLLMHAEHSLMIRTIRQEYYISRLRSNIKKCIRNCKTCIIYKQKTQSQIMAALPSERSSFSLPFNITGLDFAGPFSIKTSIIRQAAYHKGYVCIFVCFSTKALHLELCSDLSSNSFLAAFTRFVGRRGLPKQLFSDNGTNFIGAERKLRNDFLQFIKSSSKDISEKYASHGFNWSFIPPNAPHMGGIWEAGVKSFKTHFRKVSQNYKYTFEEFSTLLVRIEAVLNSRPLSPMTDDPHEILALTPGHFLRGAPLIAFPESPLEEITFVDRWDKLKCLQHQFARRWKDEYLKELHRRHKWQNENEDVTVGQLVVVKDELLPPCEWRAPRNSNLHQCLICRKYHPIKYCRKFLAMSIKDRRRAVRQHGYCMNCLARSHEASGCTSPELCQVCGHAHNTLLHLPIAARLQPRPSKRNETQNHARPRNIGRSKNQLNSEQRRTSTNSYQQRLQKRRNQTHPRKYHASPQRLDLLVCVSSQILYKIDLESSVTSDTVICNKPGNIFARYCDIHSNLSHL